LQKNKGLEIPGDLEKFLKIKGNDKSKGAYDWATNVDVKDIPAEFNAIKEFLQHSI